MKCLQCGKFFVERGIYDRYCSIECYTKAQVDSLRIAPTTFNLYHNGEEVKRVDFSMNYRHFILIGGLNHDWVQRL